MNFNNIRNERYYIIINLITIESVRFQKAELTEFWYSLTGTLLGIFKFVIVLFTS